MRRDCFRDGASRHAPAMGSRPAPRNTRSIKQAPLRGPLRALPWARSASAGIDQIFVMDLAGRGTVNIGAMLWIKAFHQIFMVTWFAGLFYLPRLFVYHAVAVDDAEKQRLAVMERRLFGIMTIGACLTAILGFWLLFEYAWRAYSSFGWLHAKLLLVAGLVGYHAWCWWLMKRFAGGEVPHSQRWFRIFNEVPALFLIAIVVLAVVKPF